MQRSVVRVCRAGGVIGLASWTPEGFIGEMFRLFSKYTPATAGLAPPIRWGDEGHLRAIFGDAIASMTNQVRTTVFRFASAKENVDFFRKYYGPTLKTFEALPTSGREALEREMIELNYRFDLNGGKGGPIAIAADYLETVIVSRRQGSELTPLESEVGVVNSMNVRRPRENRTIWCALVSCGTR